MSRPFNKSSIIWLYPEDQFKQLVADNDNYTAMLKHFGMRNAGHNARTLKHRIVELQLDVSHVVKHKTLPVPYNVSNDLLFVENSAVCRSTIRIRIIKENLIEYKCRECNTEPVWQHKPLSLVLDHINGIPNDHRLKNLRFLCPNCNSQTPTFCGRNRTTEIKRKQATYKYTKKLKTDYALSQAPKVQLIEGLNIDFTKHGWVTKASKAINYPAHKFNYWIKRVDPDFFIRNNCFRRKDG